MPKITINNKQIEVEEGITLIQACMLAGLEIPHFCFHERLNVAGNCRMCLVEVEKSPKLVASCAMPVSDGMVVHTDSMKVKKAREDVMEMLLINHPLDCPICDQGGECDLQDQAFRYGSGKSKFSENKRSVKDKYMGPLVKTHMTRCIHCTRCIRFATEIAGVSEIGALYRGEHMQITSYLEKTLISELSGNIIDICPVGALTSKPYEFKARSWELNKTESIDVLDAVGSNIRIDSRGLEVMRILPKQNDAINEEWLDDRARFSYDGLKYQRLTMPYIKKNGKLVESSWEEALDLAAAKIKELQGSEIAVIAGNLSCAESMFALKLLFQYLGSNNLSANQYGYKFDTSGRRNYLFNTTIAGIEQADLCLLIGANPRLRAPILNARIGKAVRFGNLKVFSIGEVGDQTYKINTLGDSLEILSNIAAGKHEFCQLLQSASKPMIIVGDGVYSRDDAEDLWQLIHQIVDKYQLMTDKWSGFNVLHNYASSVTSLDIGFTASRNEEEKRRHAKLGPESHEILNQVQNDDYCVPQMLNKAEQGEIKLVYLLGADEIDMTKLTNSFVIYQGHHGESGASVADIIFPAPSYTEKDATYVNLEGRAQHARRAVDSPGEALEEWLVISKLAKLLGHELPSTLPEIRQSLSSYSPVFANIGKLTGGEFKLLNGSSSSFNNSSDNSAVVTRQNPRIEFIPYNYYMNNIISRTSLTMAKCVREIAGLQNTKNDKLDLA